MCMYRCRSANVIVRNNPNNNRNNRNGRIMVRFNKMNKYKGRNKYLKNVGHDLKDIQCD